MGALAWQPTLFGWNEPTLDAGFGNCVRHRLDASTWVEHVRDWVSGADAAFSAVLDGQTTPLPHVGSVLGERYSLHFDRTETRVLTSGRDEIRWQRSTTSERITSPVVALVALGERRTLRMRVRHGGGTTSFVLDPGDLLVMGGASQHGWEHSVPRARRVRGPSAMIFCTHSRGVRQSRS